MNSLFFHRLVRIFTILVFGIFILFIVKRAFTSYPGYDESYNAAVAKNLSLGLGYSTDFPSLQKFNPDISTGPLLILPAAFLMKLFGNLSWVPNLTGVVLNLLLLFSFLFVSKKYIFSPKEFWPFVLLSNLFFIFWSTIGGITSTEELFLKHWYGLVGDIPCALLIALGTALFLSSMSLRVRALSGLLLGLAVSTKSVALIGVVGISGIFLAKDFTFFKSADPRQKRNLFYANSVAVLAFLSPLIAFSLWKKISLTSEELSALKIQEWLMFKRAGSGIGPFLASTEKIIFLRTNERRNYDSLIAYSGGLIPPISAIILGIVAMVSLYKNRFRESVYWLSLALFAAFFLHAVWWTLFSTTGWIRHLLPALIWYFIALSIAIVCMKSRSLKFACLTLVLISTTPRLAESLLLVPQNFSPEPRLVSLIQARDFLVEEAQKKSALLACGWWIPRDIDYLMPAAQTFQDCVAYQKTGGSLDKSFLVQSDLWVDDPSLPMNEFVKTCRAQIVFSAPPYRVLQCRPEIKL